MSEQAGEMNLIKNVALISAAAVVVLFAVMFLGMGYGVSFGMILAASMLSGVGAAVVATLVTLSFGHEDNLEH